MYEIKQELNHQTLEGWRVVHDYSDLKTNGSNYPELQQDAPLPYGLQSLFHTSYSLYHTNEQ
jgi:hypothetical protein